jgi:tetratricopeptide (TPR) repeat protein
LRPGQSILKISSDVCAVLDTVSDLCSLRPPHELSLCHALALLELLATRTAPPPHPTPHPLELTDPVTLAQRTSTLLTPPVLTSLVTSYATQAGATPPAWAPSDGKTALAITVTLRRTASESLWSPFFWLGEALSLRGDYPAARAVLDLAVGLTHRLEREWTLIRWFSVVSLACVVGFGLGRTEVGYGMLREAEAAGGRVGVRPMRMAEVAGKMGRMAEMMGDEEAAEGHYTAAVRVLDSIVKDDAGDSLHAELLDALGGLWRDSPEGAEGAILVLERAIHVRDVLSSSRPGDAGRVVDAALARANLAAALEAQGRTREALLFANKARDLLLALPAAGGEAQIDEALAFVELALGRMLLALGENGSPDSKDRLLAGAEAHLQASRSLVVPAVGTAHHSVCVIDHLLARLYLVTRREAQAEELAALCTKITDTPECGNLALLGRMYETLARAKSACGRGPLEELPALRRALELTSMTTAGDVGVGTRALRKRIADLEKAVKRQEERKKMAEQASQQAALEAFLKAAQWQRDVEDAKRLGRSVLPPQARPPAPETKTHLPTSSFLQLPAVQWKPKPSPSPRRPPSAPAAVAAAAAATTTASASAATTANTSPAPSAPSSRPSTSMARMLRAVSRAGSSQVGKRQFPTVSPAAPLPAQPQRHAWDYEDFVKRYTAEPELTVVEERKQAKVERAKRQMRDRPKVETATQIWERRRRIEERDVGKN